jgi:hypothetical protein
VDSGGVLAQCKNCYLYSGGGFGFEFETQSFLRSIRIPVLNIDVTLNIPTGNLIYIKLWVDFIFTYSINVDVQVEASAGTEPAYTYSLDLQESVVSTTVVDVKSSSWSSLKPVLEEDIYFQVRNTMHRKQRIDRSLSDSLRGS